LAIGVVVEIGMEALELFATQPLLTRLLNKGPDLLEFRRLIGNTTLLILGIVLAWVLAAFGEEMVYRGYLLNRCADHRPRRPGHNRCALNISRRLSQSLS
jgi:membrane protease YdiL (CAAX protease family)